MLKRYLSCIFLAIISCYVWNTVYHKYLAPSFFSDCINRTKEWNNELRQQSTPCYVLSGGSEVRMSIEAGTMYETHGVRAVNAGVTAGCGVRCNAQTALPFLRSGDTLMISYIPGNDNLPNDGMSHQGINFCHVHQGFSPFIDGILPVTPYSVLSLFHGSSRSYAYNIISLLTGRLPKYFLPEIAQISPTGRAEVFENTEQSVILENGNSCIPGDVPLKIELVGWLPVIEDLRSYCELRNIHLVMYISRAHRSSLERKRMAAAALSFLDLGIPIVKDPFLGCWEDSAMFSDSALHLSIEGGKIFSEFLASQLKNNQYWTRQELESIINGTDK